MALNRARGSARRSVALFSAALLLVTLAPLQVAAGTPAKTPFTTSRTSVARTVAHVDALAASRISPRRVPAAAQLLTKSRPATAAHAPKSTHAPRTASPSLIATPPLAVSKTIFTQTQSDTLLEPPDPWVVANSSYVLSTSNGVVRVMSRAGATLADIPTFVLFDTDTLHYESDPRILWDAAHGRWVGVVVTYDYPTFADNSLTLVVSDTANPLGTWTVHRLNYLANMPDYPGIASTSDKIVLTANLYLGGSSYNGTSYQLVSWASLIAGGTTASPIFGCTGCWNFRPARNSGAAVANAYLVYERDSTNTLWLADIAGPIATPTTVFNQDLGIAAGYYGPTGVEGFDHQPRQPGGTVSDAVDGRIPDVAMFGDTVYFARTNQANQGGTGNDLVVQAYTTSIAAAAAALPTYGVNTWGQMNQDDWMPGVGISKGDATTGPGYFLSYMLSSDTVTPQAYAAGSLDGSSFGSPVLVAGSSAPYTSTYGRWGDFMGITPDTNGTMAVWSATEVAGPDGGWQEVVDRLVLDATAPLAAPGIPTQSLVAGTKLGTGIVSVKVAYTAATDLQSGIRSYFVEEGQFGGVVVTPRTSYVLKVPAYTYGSLSAPDGFRVSASNEAGLWSPTSAWGVPLTASVFQQTLSYTKFSSGWTNQSGSAYSGGSAKSSSKAGATASFKMSGRSFAWVSYRASNRGKAKVYVDGVLKGTITLKSSATSARYIPYAITFSASGTHTIKIVVVSGRVDVDGFVVLR